MSFLGEIKRRKIFQVAAVYAVVAWLLVQIVATVEAPLGLPDWVDTLVIVLLVVGLPVTLIMSWGFDLTREGLVRDQGPSHARSGSGRTLEYVLIGLLVVAVGWVLYRVEVAPIDNPIAEVDSGVLPNSVAVLLCENFSPDPENDYFAASLHQEMLTRLGKLRGLNLIGRASVLQYVDTAKPIVEIASELRVESIMECSVAYGEGRIAIGATLSDGDSGVQLWGDRYNRKLEDVFDVQADIARNIADALQAEFSLAESEAIERAPTSSAAAYALYLQAKSVFDGTAGRLVEIDGLLDRAIEIDPDFASAYGFKALISVSLLINTSFGAALPADDRSALETDVRELAEHALELDSTAADARAALREIDILTWHWSDAVEAVEPHDEPTLITNQLWVYSWMGRHEEAVRLAKRVVELNPNDLTANWSLGVVYSYARNFPDSTRSLQRAVEIAPAVPALRSRLASNKIAVGDMEGALADLQDAEQLLGAERPILFLPSLAYAYSRIGRSNEVRRLVDELRARADGTDVGAGGWAMAHLAMGDEQNALEQLEAVAEKARRHELDPGFINVMNLKMNHLADPRLEQPQFVNVFSRIRGD